ncbi:hypothetical protein DNTS_014985, partial [Danionella cerebrum]
GHCAMTHEPLTSPLQPSLQLYYINLIKREGFCAEPKAEPWENKMNQMQSSKQVKNYRDGSWHQDSLHHMAVKSYNFTSTVCEGSLMNPKSLMRVPKFNFPASDDILMLAVDFINQYYKSIKNSRIEEHLSRVEEVTMEINATGSYQLTVKELEFAVKQAWRNAPRCIGRIQWANLQLFDARHCRSAEEMFQMLCNHIQFATNGGNLRSAITVFPQRTEEQREYRVWNSQLIQYAGYKMMDGTIKGDPANVNFTEICIQLGWTPKYGQFDVLPLVLQANGEDPQFFEIPKHLVLEVPMEHPQYEWFKDLNLRWYALPAVSSMLLEVGGLEFPACPFNGWYMGTEIGVRDFCDTQRYNILEKVAKKMGLETQKLSSLWKDQALVAVNVAKNKVTITDHHSASESFMQYMETDVRLRGGCPADWVWLVPPMSGSLTAVYHQEMLNYILSPFFYYQPEAWLTHKWKDKKTKRRCRLSFKGLIRVVLFTQILIKSAMAKRVRCTVLYATETGKSQNFAKKLNVIMNCAFNSKVLCMEDYDFSELEKETLLIIITSTFGSGNSPGNGESFKKQLFRLKILKNPVRFCVFGLGSRMYPHFCAFAHALDAQFAALGGIRVSATGEGDELNGQDEAFSAWAQKALKDACKEFSIEEVLPGTGDLEDSWNPQCHRVLNDCSTLDRIGDLSALHSKAVYPMKLKRRQNLQSAKSSRATILVELEIEGSSEPLNFAPGDHVGIFPGNSPELVAGVLKHLSNPPPINQSIRLESLSVDSAGGERWLRDERMPACPLSQALTYYLDITSPPSQSFLRKLSMLARLEMHKQGLLALATDSQVYRAWKDFYKPTFLEVLEEFPSLEISAEFLLTQLPLVKPRLYSVSSSPSLHPNQLHLTVSVVRYCTQEGKGPLHFGLCSNWLNTIKEGDMVPCFFKSSDWFHLPADPNAPCILVGVGSGIAPFRSFWQQQFYDMEKKGLKGNPITLVFGCRSSDTDHLYKDEIQVMRDNGTISSITTAYSRQTGQPKVYVQDILQEQLSDKIIDVLHQKTGYIYICGGMRMACEVAATIQKILVCQLNITTTQAEEYLSRLKAEKHYLEDIFGSYVRDLMRGGLITHEKRPVWYDVKFFRVYGAKPFELNKPNFVSLSEKFVKKYKELESRGDTEPELLFEETAKALLYDGITLAKKGKPVKVQSKDLLLTVVADNSEKAQNDPGTETNSPQKDSQTEMLNPDNKTS